MPSFSNIVLASAAVLAVQASPAPIFPRAIGCPAANGTLYTTGNSTYKIECGIDRFMGDMPQPNGQPANLLEDCVAQCQARKGCVMVNFLPRDKACYVKSSVGSVRFAASVDGAVLTSALPNGTVRANTTLSTSSLATFSATVVSKSTSSATTVSKSTSLATVVSKSTSSATVVSKSTSSATTSTRASATPTASPPVLGNGGKRGLCFNDASLTKLFATSSSSKVSWAYNWGQTTSASTFNKNLKYIPMLWSGSSDRTSTWASAVQAGIAGGADALLGFNEPDHAQQANMAVSTAVTAWRSSMQPYAGRAQLGSPAVTNGGSPMGLTWLRSFLSACTDCTIDFCAVHWYDSATNVAYFKNHMADAHDACGGKPIWLTEFGASGTDDQVIAFLKEVLPWLDQQPWVARYAYFMANAGILVDASGTTPSRIGSVYDSL